MKHSYYQSIIGWLNELSLLGLTFLIPFNSVLMRYMLGIFIVSSLLLYRKNIGNLKQKSYMAVVWVVLLFLVYAVSFFYSHQSHESLLDLQKKLSLFLLPLAFALNIPSNTKKYRLSLVYLAGVLLVSLICIFFFTYRIFSDPHFQRVFLNHPFYQVYSKFYFFGNANYYAAYLNMAVLLILGMIVTNALTVKKQKIKWLLYPGLFLFIGLSLMLSSRAGILALIIILLISAYHIFPFRYFITSALVLFVLSGFYMTRNYRFDNYRQLLKQVIESPDKVDEEFLLQSDALRLVLWKASIGIIKENTVFGVGNGDVGPTLHQQFKKMDVYEQLKEKDNPHNQFFRTFIATGLIGFLALAGIFAYGFLVGIRHKNYILTTFFILILIQFLTKSMLFRIDGVVFFSFFYGLFCAVNSGENTDFFPKRGLTQSSS